MSTGASAAAPTLAGPTWHRFLSPHYDDVALSCGGTVALLAQSEVTPEISVVFGAEPETMQSLSPFAAAMHAGWGLSATDVIARRRQEEAIAAGVLGATSGHLPFADAIYRGGHYQSDEALFGAVVPTELALAAEVAAELRLEPEHRISTRFYAPLGIGGHVDHQICFLTAVDLAHAGWDVWFYEDMPYALQADAPTDRLRRLGAQVATAESASGSESRLAPIARVPVASTWEAKLTAIFAYASQVPTIFRHVAPDGARRQVDAALRDYALRLGDGVVVEQFWRLAATETAASEPQKIVLAKSIDKTSTC